jgi:hypothetical protein
MPVTEPDPERGVSQDLRRTYMRVGVLNAPRVERGGMERIAVIGNAGGGKSTLARTLAARRDRPYVEVDALLWREGWQPTPMEECEAGHARLIAGRRWVIDGLGRLESLAARRRPRICSAPSSKSIATGCRKYGGW